MLVRRVYILGHVFDGVEALLGTEQVGLDLQLVHADWPLRHIKNLHEAPPARKFHHHLARTLIRLAELAVVLPLLIFELGVLGHHQPLRQMTQQLNQVAFNGGQLDISHYYVTRDAGINGNLL